MGFFKCSPFEDFSGRVLPLRSSRFIISHLSGWSVTAHTLSTDNIHCGCTDSTFLLNELSATICISLLIHTDPEIFNGHEILENYFAFFPPIKFHYLYNNPQHVLEHGVTVN